MQRKKWPRSLVILGGVIAVLAGSAMLLSWWVDDAIRRYYFPKR
jgi:hypothetical protein